MYIFFSVIALFSILILIRCRWVYNKRIWWIEKTRRANINLIKNWTMERNKLSCSSCKEYGILCNGCSKFCFKCDYLTDNHYDSRIPILHTKCVTYNFNNSELLDKNRNALSSYNDMLFRLWCWDVNKFIKDEEAFKLVKKWDRGEETA